MQLKDLTTTIASQIPIVGVDVLSPDETTTIEYIQHEVTKKLELPVYFWNLGVSSLEQVKISNNDGGLVFTPTDIYKKPAHADPLLYIFQFIQDFNGDGVFILGDVHPFIAKNSPALSWEILTRVKNLYHRLKPTEKRIVLIGQQISLHDSLIRLIPVAEVSLPKVDEVINHINDFLEYFKNSAKAQQTQWSSSLTASQTEELARATLGLTLEEVSDFIRLYIKKHLTARGIEITTDIITAAVEYKTGMLAQMGIELGKSAVIPFGGLDLFRQWLLARAKLFTSEAATYNLPQPKGVLLAGPPGTGKTLIAKNIAAILRLPLLQLDIARMLGSLVGESEGNVRRALKTALAIKPCVLWIDEVDKALGNNSDSSGVSQRILGTILTFMAESDGGVFVVATANDVKALPAEFKRKGRFDENFFVNLPTATERQAILKIHLERFGCSELPDEYLEAIASSTDKFSGAELENLAAEAAILAFHEGRAQQIALADLENSRSTIVPLAITDAAAVERMQEWAKTARPASNPVQEGKTKSLRTAKMRNLN
ncbi:AAA family ATPase [Chlorogloea sp. CCALA 695]|uniref:AAA family ATPase n=1 Tax=Chlorogloea sp. CCALA 695 TaxID=2107693 RepID=UPI000D050E33|nr:AAA family ATPase [Chlorogloea sp. CCALA 695]PSB28538.1 ATPase [Chlorogloea sp. CCALA 695]